MRIYHETLYLIGFVIGLIMMIMSIIFLLKAKKPKFERLFCAGIILGAIILGGSTVMLGRNILNPIEINRISEIISNIESKYLYVPPVNNKKAKFIFII